MNNHDSSAKRNSALDPVSRMSEILFGLIMVLTFTSSMRAAEVIREDVREMFWGALGCNLAWGIIDAFMYLINTAAERGREELIIRRLQTASNTNETYALLREALPESISTALTEPNLDQIRTSLLKVKTPNSKWLLKFSDFRAALTVFALVFVTIFPVTLPFMFMQDEWRALRVSNLIALVMLFGLGFKLGRYSGRSPWYWGLKMAAIGVVLAAVAISFGG